DMARLEAPSHVEVVAAAPQMHPRCGAKMPGVDLSLVPPRGSDGEGVVAATSLPRVVDPRVPSIPGVESLREGDGDILEGSVGDVDEVFPQPGDVVVGTAKERAITDDEVVPTVGQEPPIAGVALGAWAKLEANPHSWRVAKIPGGQDLCR